MTEASLLPLTLARPFVLPVHAIGASLARSAVRDSPTPKLACTLAQLASEQVRIFPSRGGLGSPRPSFPKTDRALNHFPFPPSARFKGHELAHCRCAFGSEGLCSEEGGPNLLGEIYPNAGPGTSREPSRTVASRLLTRSDAKQHPGGN